MDMMNIIGRIKQNIHVLLRKTLIIWNDLCSVALTSQHILREFTSVCTCWTKTGYSSSGDGLYTPASRTPNNWLWYVYTYSVTVGGPKALAQSFFVSRIRTQILSAPATRPPDTHASRSQSSRGGVVNLTLGMEARKPAGALSGAGMQKMWKQLGSESWGFQSPEVTKGFHQGSIGRGGRQWAADSDGRVWEERKKGLNWVTISGQTGWLHNADAWWVRHVECQEWRYSRPEVEVQEMDRCIRVS